MLTDSNSFILLVWKHGRPVVLCALALLLPVGCASEPPPEEPLRPARVLQVFATGGNRTRTFSGTTQASVESKISFKVSGTLEKIHVKVGDRVRKGQLLAEMDPQDYDLQVEDAQASLAQARAMARNSAANLARIRGLYESNNASQADYDAALSGFQSTEAQVNSIAKKLELSRSQRSYTTLNSPVAGAISEVNAEVNENVTPGQAVLVLSSGSKLEVGVAVPEVFISRIREGQSVEVQFDSLPGQKSQAVVTEVGIASTGAATTFPVIVRLEQNPPEVRPGMAAVVAFSFASADTRERFIVPPVAVGEDRNGRFVFVVRSDEPGTGLVSRRTVRVGELTADGLEVMEGLEDGDLLVTAGLSRIEEGTRVKLPDEGTSGS